MLILCQHLLVRIFAHCFFSWFVQELYLAWNASTRTSLQVHFFGSIILSVSIKMYRMISSGSMDIQKNVMTFRVSAGTAGTNRCYLNQTHNYLCASPYPSNTSRPFKTECSRANILKTGTLLIFAFFWSYFVIYWWENNSSIRFC